MFEIVEDNEAYVCRRLYGRIEMGIYPELYGWRVAAGIISDKCYTISYACGNDQKEVETIYSLVLTILTNKLKETTDPHLMGGTVEKWFPRQEKKPLYKDHECYMALLDLCGPEMFSIKLPNLSKERFKYMYKNHSDKIDVFMNLGALNNKD